MTGVVTELPDGKLHGLLAAGSLKLTARPGGRASGGGGEGVEATSFANAFALDVSSSRVGGPAATTKVVGGTDAASGHEQVDADETTAGADIAVDVKAKTAERQAPTQPVTMAKESSLEAGKPSVAKKALKASVNRDEESGAAEEAISSGTTLTEPFVRVQAPGATAMAPPSPLAEVQRGTTQEPLKSRPAGRSSAVEGKPVVDGLRPAAISDTLGNSEPVAVAAIGDDKPAGLVEEGRVHGAMADAGATGLAMLGPHSVSGPALSVAGSAGKPRRTGEPTQLRGELRSSSTAPAQELKTIVATPRVLELGLDAGTHGWLRVRAELGRTGEVRASMVASSAGAAETLRKEAPGIADYLKNEALSVSSLEIRAAEPAGAKADADGWQGGSWSQEQRAAGNSRGDEREHRGIKMRSDSDLDEVRGLDKASASISVAPMLLFGAQGSGSWLSVRV